MIKFVYTPAILYKGDNNANRLITKTRVSEISEMLINSIEYLRIECVGDGLPGLFFYFAVFTFHPRPFHFPKQSILKF